MTDHEKSITSDTAAQNTVAHQTRKKVNSVHRLLDSLVTERNTVRHPSINTSFTKHPTWRDRTLVKRNVRHLLPSWSPPPLNHPRWNRQILNLRIVWVTRVTFAGDCPPADQVTTFAGDCRRADLLMAKRYVLLCKNHVFLAWKGDIGISLSVILRRWHPGCFPCDIFWKIYQILIMVALDTYRVLRINLYHFPSRDRINNLKEIC